MALTADHLKAVLRRFHERLAHHREALNRLNVYPVPDGDTGTNMALTLEAVMAEVDGATSMGEVAAAMAHGSLMGARGNSGIILSQILRGLADRFGSCDELGAEEISDALTSASDAAYRAVMRPVEGTILTVVREAAGAARATGTHAGTDVAGFLDGIYRRGLEALERTPELLPVLQEAGVVDAGGAGLLLLLAAFVEEATGGEIELPESIYRAPVAVLEPVTEEPGIADLRYEVMFLLEAGDEAVEAFRNEWMELGDSIVVVGGDGHWNCHIHTDHIGPAIEAGVRAGRPHRIEVTDLLEQAAAAAHHGPSFEPLDGVAEASVGVLAVAIGGGVVERFRQLGAQAVVAGGQSMNPSTLDLLAAVEAMPAAEVIVLPNNKNIIAVADQLDALTDKQVKVVPTRSIPGGMAAMLGYLPDAELDAVASQMAAEADAVTSGELTRAVRTVTIDGMRVEEGSWIGLVDGVLATVDPDQVEALLALLGAVVTDDAEIVTVITGEGATIPGQAAVETWVAARGSGLAVEFVDGGQPLYPYLLAVE